MRLSCRLFRPEIWFSNFWDAALVAICLTISVTIVLAFAEVVNKWVIFVFLVKRRGPVWNQSAVFVWVVAIPIQIAKWASDVICAIVWDTKPKIVLIINRIGTNVFPKVNVQRLSLLRVSSSGP
jgi:hypothetical protein